MSLLFLFPLAVTLGSSFVFKTSKDTSTETAIAAFAIGLVGLALTLILAPWEIQLLLLLLLIANVRWLALSNFLFSRSQDIQIAPKARDAATSTATVSTQATPSGETALGETASGEVVMGKYRGAVCPIGRQADSHLTELSTHQPAVVLQYRGAKVR
jgi:predicted MFS family arabinose efflux permease